MANAKPRKNRKMGFGSDFVASLAADFAHSIAREVGGNIFDAFKRGGKEQSLKERVQPLPEDAQRKVLDLVEKLKRFEASLGDLTTDEKERRMKEYRDLLLNQKPETKPKTTGFNGTLEGLDPPLQRTFWRWMARLDEVRRGQVHARKGDLHASALQAFLAPFAQEESRTMTAEEAKTLHSAIMSSLPPAKSPEVKKNPLENLIKQAETLGGLVDPGEPKPVDPHAERKARERRARTRAARKMF